MVKRTITGIVMAGFLFLIIWLTNFSHFIFDAFVFIVSALPYILLVSVPGIVVIIIIFARKKKK